MNAPDPQNTAQAPEAWLFVSSDPEARERVSSELQADQDLYIQWRWRHALVRCVDNADLLPALRSTLAAGAPMVHLFHAMGPGALRALMGVPMKPSDADRVRMVRLDGSSAEGLFDELRLPDGGVQAGWLFSGRRSRRVIDGGGRDQSFLDEEALAFERWSAAFVASYDADELDAIYGQGEAGIDEIESEQPQPDEDGYLEPPASLPRWEDQVVERRWRYDDDEGLQLAASSARSADLATPAEKRLCRVSLLAQLGNRQSADGEVEVFDVGPAVEPGQQRISVKLTVWGPRWAAQVDRVVGLIPQRRRPILLQLPADTRWQAWTPSARRTAILETLIDQHALGALAGCSVDIF